MLSIILQTSTQFDEVIGLQFFLRNEFWHFVLRFFYNSIWVLILSYFLYYKTRGTREYLFTYLLISAVVFQICSLLNVVPIELGFALGLFAVFGIIRYRTNPIRPREMTYLFVVIGITVKNALANKLISIPEIVVSDLLIFILAFVGEQFLKRSKHTSIELIYDRLDLLKPEKYPELLQDLSRILGVEVNKAEMGRIDVIKGQVRMKIYYPKGTGIPHFDENKD